MNNGDIFELLNIILSKETEGSILAPDRYTELLQMSSNEKANADFAYFEKSRVITDSLRQLITSVDVTITAGEGDFDAVATDYWHVIGVKTDTARVDILTSAQFNKRKNSSLMVPTADFPVARIFG